MTAAAKPPHTALGIVGPTASGKSDLAVELARAISGEVVNVDSVQIYKDFNIGAAKLSEDEMRGVPHHCIDIFSPSEQSNVSQFRDAALAAIDSITKRGNVPILTGGSGMYLTVLLHGLANLPDTPPELRDEVQKLTNDEIHAQLQEVDPVTATRLHVNDRQRTSRALEVWRIAGVKTSQLIESHRFSDVPVRALLIVLCHPREELYDRIHLRSKRMVEMGLLEETEQLMARYGDVPLLSTIGYLQAKEHLQGRLPKADLVQQISQYTRRFAKRQMTYLRNEPRKRGWQMRPIEGEGVLLESQVQDGIRSGRRATHQKAFEVLCFSYAELLQQVQARLQEGILATEVWYVWLR